jgi:hypothetical protein
VSSRRLVAELREHLQRALPDHMVPAALLVVDRIPLTVNGKIDRRQLPDPSPDRPALRAAFVPPRNPVEDALARVFREVLGVAAVGVLDNFFELGGHSLLATQVASRVHSALHVHLPLRQLFATPTVAGIAPCVIAALARSASGEALAQALAAVEAIGPIGRTGRTGRTGDASTRGAIDS